MTDYSKMSDADINLRIAEIMHPGKTFTLAYSFGHPEGPMVQWIQGYAEYLKLDYCNNPADAWPIIIKNRIHIDPPLKDFLPWKADRGVAFECTHENPLRAAMVVFLKLKEHEC